MTERAYTVSEIDALRNAVKERYMFGTTYVPPGHTGRGGLTYRENEMMMAVEQQTRTFMLAGITAEDIVAEDKAKYEASASRRGEIRGQPS